MRSREAQPDLVIKGLEHEEEKLRPKKPIALQLLEYFIHINNTMLIFWFSGALIAKITLGNSYEPYAYSFLTNGALILCAVKFLIGAIKSVSRLAKHIGNLIRIIDIILIVGWTGLLIAGEILRINYDLSKHGNYLQGFYIAVYRTWCFFFITVVALYFIVGWARKYWLSKHYHPQVNDSNQS